MGEFENTAWLVKGLCSVQKALVLSEASYKIMCSGTHLHSGGGGRMSDQKARSFLATC